MIPGTLLIKNANIITLDKESSIAQAVLVEGGIITKIWRNKNPSEKEIPNSENVKQIDLKGQTLIPGFIDTHSHLLMYSQFRNQVNCSSPANKSISDILMRIKKEAESKEDGEWIIGWGYDDTLLKEKRHPTNKELDTVSPNNPVFLRHTSVHFAAVNSKALTLANIPNDIPNPAGGEFGRDEHGELNGVLHEFSAMKAVEAIMPAYTEKDLVSLLEEGSIDYLAQGITTATDAGVGLTNGIIEYNAHIKSVKEDKVKIRMRYMILHSLLKGNTEFSGYSAGQLADLIQEDTNGKAKLDSAKLFQDGSIQGLTAALRIPYHNRTNFYGALTHNQDILNHEVQNLHDRGFRIAIHGNGDKAIASNIEAFENALTNSPSKNHRHRIEHLQTASLEDLTKMKKLGIEASFFINHVYYWGERHRSIFLGEKRAERLNPLKDASNLGFNYTLHSDCPVTPISPLFSIWVAVNRLTSAGKELGEKQRIDILTALKTMTLYGAYLNFEEDITGSIEIGKRADFAVLDTDILNCDPKIIKNIKVLGTIIGGEIVYDNLSN